jgi:hypothetical protein
MEKRSLAEQIKRAKKRQLRILDEALRNVSIHDQPNLKGQDVFGTVVIKERDATGRDHMRTKVCALRDDPIGLMFRRGQLRREGDRDENDAAVRLQAARWYQAQYARAEIGGAKAIDLTIPKVDGGMIGSNEKTRLDAIENLARVDARVGEFGSGLLRLVLGEGRKIGEAAALLGYDQTNWDGRYFGRRMAEVLTTIAEMRGLILRPARHGPRKLDQWDIFARHAKHPELIKAILRAREV